ncbi:MAG: hypothetical protein ABJK37_12215 [Paraglaciecola sp.]|uniref:hypothetical protein n=1 Tax=Paraglaciecola sp. TaxID=1920173 RepID=UPI003298D1DF
MAISETQFLHDLFDEHVDEASFLHQQKISQLRAQEITWAEIHDDEQRFAAHVDALIINGVEAEPYLAKKTGDFDSEQLFVYVSFLIRADKFDRFLNLLEEIDFEDLEIVENVSLALVFDIPLQWLDKLKNTDFKAYPHYLPIFLPAFVFRNSDLNPEWFLNNQHVTLSEQPLNIEVLGKSNSQVASDILAKQLPTMEGGIRKLCISALFKLGHENILDYIQQCNPQKEWPFSVLALGCGSSFAQYCRNIATADYNEELVEAIGIIGLTENIPLLITLLEDEALAQKAAEAIYTISGAKFTTKVFIPEEWEETELFDDEKAKFEAGEGPCHADGRPFGETIELISLEPKDWTQWWQHSKDKFNSDLRYRFGRPVSPMTLIDVVSLPNITNNIRSLCLDELEIRYGLQCFVHLESSFIQQDYYLKQLAKWGEINDHKFKAGAWYFNAKQM